VAFWNSKTLQKRLPELITGYDADNVSTGSYELGLGSEAYITGQKKKIQIGEKGHIVIPAGQFAQLITEESVRIPAEAVGFISIKSEFKLWGLINVSGFHVDPGFYGKLIFSVYNAGVQDIVISRRTRVFLLWLSSWDEPGDVYKGKRLGQKSIPDEDMMKIRGEIPSPVVLQRKIERLQNKVATYTNIAGILIGLTIAILAKVLIYDPAQTKTQQNVPKEQPPAAEQQGSVSRRLQSQPTEGTNSGNPYALTVPSATPLITPWVGPTATPAPSTANTPTPKRGSPR
jgi:dCTP deaminase